MAKYTGPACRICRRMGEKLMIRGARCFTPKCAAERRPKPPGAAQGRRRLSERGAQLKEKQKARYTYGVMERQFKRFFAMAEAEGGIAGDNLLVLLERRLDNIVYRLGFADSIRQARQLVDHGHIMLNGHRADIPSMLVKEGDVITWRAGSTNTEYYKIMVQALESKVVPGWLSLKSDNDR